MKILFLSERSNPSARMILRMVSIRQGIPLSIRAMVIGETFAALASSALLISKDSLVSFSAFCFIDPFAAVSEKEKIVLLCPFF